MLRDITHNGVLRAMQEFDQLGRTKFLEKYGFGASRSYFLTYQGQRYDSKAICGAAHGFDFPDQGPLLADEFSGGQAVVVKTLESLGFECNSSSRKMAKQLRGSSRAWTEPERLLALDLYLRHQMLDDRSPLVLDLSEELRRLALHPEAGTRENFRNPNAVAMKLANFASLDPQQGSRGLNRASAGDRESWKRFAGDTDLLSAAAATIRAGLWPEAGVPGDAGATTHPIEQVHADSYDFYFPDAGIAVQAERREAALVSRFEAWLAAFGHDVKARRYEVHGSSLRNDLADLTDRRLWEAKSEVSRSAVRMAIGQLIDYRRLEEKSNRREAWRLGVLLPREPDLDLVDLAFHVDASVAWSTSTEDFTVVHPGQAA